MRIALIGPGKVAHLHAQAVQQTPDVTLAAVCGRNEQKTADFARQYGIAPYTSVADMVSREGIDVCVVLTPHPNHREPTIAALEAGAHVLVEKPLAASLADCDAMIATAERTQRVLSVVSQRRFYAPSQRIRAAIDAGKIGTPALGMVQMLGWRDEAYYGSDPWRGSWQHEGGGVLVNQAPHQLDLLLWYMGEPTMVYGQWRNVNHPYIEVEDTAVAIVQFKNGGVGNIVASNSQKPGLYGKVHLHGSSGASVGVQTDGGSMFIAGRSGIQEPPVNDLWTVPGEEHLLAEWKEEDTTLFGEINALTHYFALQLADFCTAIREQRTPAITAQDGRRVVQLFEAIYESQRTGQAIRIS
ncbi:oxidoreductase domain protein [Fibrella aestuarina BUZ 2]|uniref:Oxidoreductase domain protein n=1 Tax=Fibrella aestuarina BUZ 2 TaxID=1166018 RepID=I0KGC8_9BACT|nr:Gfo/Idh/MocA family oxidoreductase [Fibrella aestuarina]CCH03181.1 oxidoreductase domain protein [Fibrella aestuarina BUZ 2]